MTSPRSSHEREWPSGIACLVLVGCFVVATAAVGWWGIPGVAFLWSWWAGRARCWQRGVAPAAAGAAVAAWGALLVWTAATGPLGRLTHDLGRLARVPGAVLIALTLVFAALLAWSAAALVTGD